MYHNFRKLDIWVDGIELADSIYTITSAFPMEERYGPSSQMQRAAVSVSSNIAEGAAKDSSKDYCRFLGISLGSLYELETQLEIANRRGYVETELYYTILIKITSLQRRVFTFRQHVSTDVTN